MAVLDHEGLADGLRLLATGNRNTHAAAGLVGIRDAQERVGDVPRQGIRDTGEFHHRDEGVRVERECRRSVEVEQVAYGVLEVMDGIGVRVEHGGTQALRDHLSKTPGQLNNVVALQHTSFLL